MKIVHALLITTLLAVPSMTAKAISIDGTAEAAYGSAIVTQQLGTTALDSSLGLKCESNGSELDAAYGFISNGVLYLTIAGNFDSGWTNGSVAHQYDKMSIFFMTGPGGQNVLTNGSYSGADFNNLNHMVGMKFDAGFAPNYWMSFPVGAAGTNPTAYVNFARLSTTNDPGVGVYLGSINPPNYLPLTNTTVTGASAGNPLIAAIDNSNIAGVAGDPSGCETNGAPFGPASVRTGFELAIPVTVIGLTTGKVSICAFVTDDPYTNVYNQVLGPITGNASYCQPSLGQSSNVNWGAFPGQHFFTIAAPPCTFGISPVSTNFNPNGGTGSFSIIVAGVCPWSVTSSVSWVTITSATSGSGPGTVNFSVGTNATSSGRQGIITLLNPPSPPLTFAVNQFGLPLGPLPVDGTADAAYGSMITTQLMGTGFGDNGTNDLNVATGSELDGAYGIVSNNILYLVLAGNLEANFNKVEIFFDTGPGGQNTLTNINPNVDFNGLNRMGAGCGTCGATNLASNPGLTFDSSFAADYWISVTCGGAPFAVYANYAQLWPGGCCDTNGFATNGYFVGQTAATTNGTLFGGTNPYTIQATVNNSNFLGVDGSGCYDDPAVFLQYTVATGVEIAIPLAAIGNPSGPIKVCAFVNGTAHDFVSNQTLGPIWNGVTTDCEPNPGEPTVVNFSALPGTHYFTVKNSQPFQPQITSISLSNQDVRVSWTTQNGFVYQLQRTLILSTNTTWSSTGSSTNGTGAIITQVDPNAGTNKPGVFYRVDQQ